MPNAVDKLELGEIRLADQTPEQRFALSTQMARAGRASGIDFNWGGKLGPNPATRDAHRLVHLVGRADKYDDETQCNLVEAIFDAYQCRAHDVAEHCVLREAAQRAGIDVADVDAWLQSDEAADLIDQQAENSKERATGVPTIIIQHDHQPGGHPGPSDLMEIFIKVREEQGPS